MKYNIRAHYTTSDSFNPPKETGCLIELNTTDLNLAKENLKRLKEQYQYYEAKHRHDWRHATEEEEAVMKNAPNQPWFVSKNSEYSIRLILDGGKDYQIGLPYCGYFESLLSLEIELDKTDLRVDF